MSADASCFLADGPIGRQPVCVFNACEKDVQMGIKNLEWMHDLGDCKKFDAVVGHDLSMNKILYGQMLAAVRKVFHTVTEFEYRPPWETRWPLAANYAFQEAAWHFYEEDGRAWFWMEADAVPLKEGWLEALAAEYWACGKPIMGAIVEGRGHCNGTAIYPANFPSLSTKAMQSTDVAWDWEMRAETIHLTHNSKLFCHIWGVEGDRVSAYGGVPASFQNQSQVDRWVCPGAVVLHRAKDGTLIDRLRERRSSDPRAGVTGGRGVMAV